MTKPMGPIPPEFARQQGMLTIAGRSAADWLAGRDGPAFVYDLGLVAATDWPVGRRPLAVRRRPLSSQRRVALRPPVLRQALVVPSSS